MARPTEYLKFDEILNSALLSDGQTALPNVLPIEDPNEALKRISSATANMIKTPYRFRIRNFDSPLSKQTHEIGYYVKIFQNGRGMGGRFDGSGVILANGKAFSFEMCHHEWDESGANHSRGWHPSVCRKCGFDASIDSGD